MPRPETPPDPGPGRPRIFISAAEPSGDRHAAQLITALRASLPQAEFFGVAGPGMQAAGCRAIADLTDRAAMLTGAFRLAGQAWLLIRRIGRMARAQRPDLAVLVDSPALHLPMAKKLKSAGCPVMAYIAPQLWAWAPWRIRRVRRVVDRLAVILPFEEEYFSRRGVAARYVGHPLVSQLRSARVDPAEVTALREAGRPVVACLPGSRSHVVREVIGGQIEVARRITQDHREAVFLFAGHPAVAEQVRVAVGGSGLNARVLTDRNAAVLSAADLALCASGTATLEVAWYRVPMVVMYNGSKWGYRLVGRWLIRTPHLSLVNILAGRRIVPEFMPYYTSTAPIAAEALSLLADDARREGMRADLQRVVESLGPADAAAGAAALARELLASSGCRLTVPNVT